MAYSFAQLLSIATDLRKGIAIISKIQGPHQLHTEPTRVMAARILQNDLDNLLGVRF